MVLRQVGEGRARKRHAAHALLVDGVKNYVFVERDPGVFEKREVTLAVQTRNHAWVWAGLKAGEKVVSVGALLLSAELASSSR